MRFYSLFFRLLFSSLGVIIKLNFEWQCANETSRMMMLQTRARLDLFYPVVETFPFLPVFPNAKTKSRSFLPALSGFLSVDCS